MKIKYLLIACLCLKSAVCKAAEFKEYEQVPAFQEGEADAHPAGFPREKYWNLGIPISHNGSKGCLTLTFYELTDQGIVELSFDDEHVSRSSLYISRQELKTFMHACKPQDIDADVEQARAEIRKNKLNYLYKAPHICFSSMLLTRWLRVFVYSDTANAPEAQEAFSRWEAQLKVILQKSDVPQH